MRAALLVLLVLVGCNAPSVHGTDPEFAPPVAVAQDHAPPTHPVAVRPPPPTPPVPVPVPPAGGDHGDWNAGRIAWRSYTDGLAEARRTNKPMLLVLWATWCGHCRNYSHVFDSDDVVAAARDFVMVKVDSDREPDVAHRYAPDGQYVPRTFFLSPQGEMLASVKAHPERWQYFFDEHDPAPLLAAMRSARTAVQ